MVEVEIYVDGVLRTIGGVTESTKCEELIRKIGKTFRKRGHLSLVYKWKGINSDIPWLLPLHGKFLAILNFLKSRFCHNAVIYLNVAKDTQKQASMNNSINLKCKNFNGNKFYDGVQDLIPASTITKLSNLPIKYFDDQKSFIPHLTLFDLKLYIHIYQKSIPDNDIVILKDYIIDQYLLILYIGKYMERIENIDDFLNADCFKKFLDLISQQEQPFQELHISALVTILDEEIKLQKMLMKTTSQLLQVEDVTSLEKVEGIDYWEEKIKDKDVELNVQKKSIRDLKSSIERAQRELTCYVENRIRNFELSPTLKTTAHQSHGVWV